MFPSLEKGQLSLDWTAEGVRWQRILLGTTRGSPVIQAQHRVQRSKLVPYTYSVGIHSPFKSSSPVRDDDELWVGMRREEKGKALATMRKPFHCPWCIYTAPHLSSRLHIAFSLMPRTANKELSEGTEILNMLLRSLLYIYIIERYKEKVIKVIEEQRKEEQEQLDRTGLTAPSFDYFPVLSASRSPPSKDSPSLPTWRVNLLRVKTSSSTR